MELTDKAVAHVVKMLDGTDGERWNGAHPMYEGICGWCGVMAPMNRPAFVAKFGEDFTNTVEGKAREVIAARAAFWENSKAKGYEAMADNAESNDPAAFEVDGFVWGVMDTLKCDHENLRECIRNLIENKNDNEERKPQLCRIVRIEEVEDIERDAATVLKGWKAQGHEGGSATDDISNERFEKNCTTWRDFTAEEKRTFYTLSVLVRDTKGRYFLIDPEGFEYPRYVILPKSWEKMYSKTVAEIVAEIRAEKEAEEKAKAEKEAADRAAYDARCEKWAGMMEKIPEGLDHYDSEYRKIGKRNVLKMAKSAFPWVRFSVSYDGGWGTGYVLKWKNGPTVDEVKNAGDYGLFMPWWDTFDGMTDCADSESAKFSDFSDKFGGVGNGVKFEREECEKDQNGDPNGKPPKPRKATGETDPGNAAEIANANREMAMADAGELPDNGDPEKGEAYWKRNEAKRGIEIYFPSMPSESVRNRMKANGWRWSRFAKAWYNRFDEGTWEFAREIVMEFNNERAVA